MGHGRLRDTSAGESAKRQGRGLERFLPYALPCTWPADSARTAVAEFFSRHFAGNGVLQVVPEAHAVLEWKHALRWSESTHCTGAKALTCTLVPPGSAQDVPTFEHTEIDYSERVWPAFYTRALPALCP